jgi:hypothetical protein
MKVRSEMSCIPDGVLRARFDGELSPSQLQECEQHLASCVACRSRSEVIGQRAKRVGAALSRLAPIEAEAPPDPAIGWARFQADVPAPSISPASRLIAKRLLPACAALAAALLIVLGLTFAPARSFAQQVLALLRVQRITVVPMEWPAGRDNFDRAAQSFAQLVSDNVVFTLKPGDPQTTDSPAQADRIAGFKVRLLANQSELPQIKIIGEQAFHGIVDLDRVHEILEEAGRADLKFPAALDGATIAVQVPKIVLTQYGKCSRSSRESEQGGETGGNAGCIHLVQAPSPTVSVPPELNMAQIAEVALQLGGMSADEARRFGQTVDWTSTLVIGLPHGKSYQTVAVDGVEGTLVDETRHGGHSRYLLLWTKNGIIYALHGWGDAADALTLVRSLK